jgi:thioredoxin-like negative regulator of GroEL
MKTTKISFILLFPIIMITLFYSCTHQTAPPPPPTIIILDHESFEKEVKAYNGPALVLFHNKDLWQSADMERRFNYFAKKFYGDARFCLFPWPPDTDAGKFEIEKTPTLVLYKNGAEFDRIKGINPNPAARRRLNDDIELWFLKNVMGLQGSEYSGKFQYRFNNTHTLQVSNY